MAQKAFKIDRISRGKIQDNAVDKEIDGIVKQVENKFNGLLNKLESFEVRNYTELKKIDLNTATLDDCMNFIGTWLKEIKEILST